MWRKIAKIAGFILAVVGVIVYICYASHLTKEYRADVRVKCVEVTLSDNGNNSNFTTVAQVFEKLNQSGIPIENELIDSVDVVNIKSYIERDGYVRDVDAYVTYKGNLYINIQQYTPVMRILSGGVNSYVTDCGQVFCQPYESAYYVPVITGSYRPHFEDYFEGNAHDYFSERIKAESEKIGRLTNEIASVRVERRKSKDEALVGLDSKEAQLKEQKLFSENYKKKLQKKSVDFANLINFVFKVSKDPFWSAELVQFVADTTHLGDISLRLVPRSGNFDIMFGTLEKSDEKLAKLYKFYDKGLPYVGWERYKVVDVRYDKQIICRE